MRARALVGLSILGLVFWSVWALRFVGVEHVGLWSVLAGVGTGAALLALRKESWRECGLHAGGDARFVLSKAGEFTVLVLWEHLAGKDLPGETRRLSELPQTVQFFTAFRRQPPCTPCRANA